MCRDNPSPPLIRLGCRPVPSQDVPNGKNATGLGKAALLLNTTDALLENGGNLGRRGLGLGVGAGLHGDSGCGISDLG